MPKGNKTQTVVTVQQQNPKTNKNQKKRRNKRKKNGQSGQARGTNQNQLASIPVARTTVVHTRGARFSGSKNGSMCVSHEELFGTVVGSDAFSSATAPINPGLSGLFPWLSQIARNYESYRFKRLRFKYVASSGSNQTGTVYLGVEFDPADAPPTDENQLASYQGTTSCAPWKNNSYTCTSQNLAKRQTYFVRNGAVGSNSDLTLYDVGFFIIGTADNQATPAKLGKLWVEYEVELMTPQTTDPGIGSSLSARFTGADKAATLPTQVGNAPLAASVNAGILTITALAPYQGLVALNMAGTVLANPVIAGTATSSAKALVVNAGGTVAVSQYTANMKRDQTMTFDFTGSTSITGYFLRFGQYNYANG